MHFISGGAIGSDTIFEELVNKYNIGIDVMSFKGHKTSAKKPNIIGESALKTADYYLVKYANNLHRKFPTNNEYVNNLLRRDYFISVFADCVVCVALIKDNQIEGGSAWAVETAKTMEKPVFVFKFDSNQWFEYDYKTGKYIECVFPQISNFKRIAGIGTRSLGKYYMAVYREIEKLIKTNHLSTPKRSDCDTPKAWIETGDGKGYWIY